MLLLVLLLPGLAEARPVGGSRPAADLRRRAGRRREPGADRGADDPRCERDREQEARKRDLVDLSLGSDERCHRSISSIIWPGPRAAGSILDRRTPTRYPGDPLMSAARQAPLSRMSGRVGTIDR